MAGSGKIKHSDLHHLVNHMSKRAFRAKDSSVLDEKILSHCLTLCGRDYKYSVINNKNGELCNHYPSKLILLEYECREASSDHQSIYDVQSMTDLFVKARFARCRTRFVMPVILVEGKHICRSATISGSGEVYGRLGLDMVFNNESRLPNGASSSDADGNQDSDVFDRLRGQDIKLLKSLKVDHICDLMLENKKVKYFVNVTSSEKVDKLNRYSDFSVWTLPYPGCEFFKKWRDKDYDGERSVFDWSQDFVNSKLELPNERHLRIPSVHWHEYKTWSLVQITQNYLHVMLQHIQSGDSGLLVHCISGWDRTPLFISLIRLSLWADGLVHKSLSALEILFLTVAYDWYQFGHDLPDRLQKGEEIFFFCFYFLKFIQEDDFVVHFPKDVARSRNASHTDLDLSCPMGVLLDADFPPFGSSSSLCSDMSQASRTDSAPQLFMTESADKDGTMTSQPLCTANISTNPVLVPEGARRPPSVSSGRRSDSPTVGSWQMVTKTGSYADSASPYSGKSSASPHSAQETDGCRPTIGRRVASFSELPDHEPSQRRKRLEEVRSLFYNAYASTVGFKNGPDPGGLTSLLDMFAEKVVALGNKLA